MHYQRRVLWSDISINFGTVPRFLRRHAVLIVIPALLVLVGSSFILERSLDPTPARPWDIGPNARHYISMTEGDFSSVDSNLKARVLVPFLARLLPVSAIDSLRIVSYLSLYVFYFFVLLTCAKLGLNTYASVGGLLTVFTSGWHLYNYHNPFLTDAFALMALSVMIFSLINRYFLVFAISAILAILAWEVTIWLVPAWFLARDRLKGTILIVVAVLVLFIPRYFIPSESNPTEQLLNQIHGIDFWRNPVFFVIGIILSWGFIWFLAPIGIWLMPKDKFVLLAKAFAILLLGAFLTSLIAVDTGRMFLILAPVFAISCAQLYTVLFRNKADIFGVSIIVALVIANAFDSVPNIVFSVGSWVLDSRTPTLLLLIFGVIYGFGTVFVLREVLFQELREKLPQIRIWFRSPAS